MQLQREQKLHYQSLQLAELERQHQERQKVYFGNFAEENKQFDSVADIDHHIGGGVAATTAVDRYPNLARLQTQLKEDRDKELPPYVRKYNRRNKQLFDLIEGTNSPDAIRAQGGMKQVHNHQHHRPHNHNHHQKDQLYGNNGHGGVALTSTSNSSKSLNPAKDHILSHKEKIERWIEENLFEEQRRNPNQIVRPPEPEADADTDQLNKLNALPGEMGPVADDGGHMGLKVNGVGGSVGGASPNLTTNRLSQTRAGNFVYHRIAQAQPSNSVGQTYGVIVRKPGLPFVAITDRRQEHNKSKHV